MLKTSKTKFSGSFRLPGWLVWVFPPSALDNVADAKVVLRRIAKALKFHGVLDQFVGSWCLGLVAGAGAALRAGSDGALSEAAEWFFRNATEVNIYFVYLTIGLACALVATHKKVGAQWTMRRVFFLPLLRLTGDAFLLASGAFVVVLCVAAWKGGLTVGAGAGATPVPFSAAAFGTVLFSMLAAFTCVVRAITDSLIDDALFRQANGRDPGLHQVLRLAGGGGILVFFVLTYTIFSMRGAV